MYPAPRTPTRIRARRLRSGLLLAALPAVLLAVALASCAPPPPPVQVDDRYKQLDPPANDRQSLLFGYLDMREAPTDLGWIELRQIEPQTDTPYYQMRVHQGVFYMEKFPPGVFVIGEFGGQRRNGQSLAYALPRSSPALRVTIREPGLHYVGAFRYRPVKDGGAALGRFEIDTVSTPSEREVLARILPFARGTPWEPRMRALLDQTARPAAH